MDRYISDDDLDRFTRFLNIDRDVIRYERDIVSFSDVESLFNDTNSYFKRYRDTPPSQNQKQTIFRNDSQCSFKC